MIKWLLLLIVLLSGIQAQITAKEMKDIPFFQNTNDVISVATSCNVVDPAKLDKSLNPTQPIYAGYLNVEKGGKSGLAFVFYGSQKATKPSDVSRFPTIIWLNGGPGSSSHIGNFLEIGPILIKPDGSRIFNKYSWNVEYNLMFVDQPIGAGYGFQAPTDQIPKDQDTIGKQFFYALTEFFQAQSGCVVGQKLYGLDTSPWFLFGESYAGKFVPSIATTILANKDIFDVPLRGIGIADGITDPISIVREMPNYAFNMGLIDYQERAFCEKAALTGILLANQGNWEKARQCFDITLNYIKKYSGDINSYNIFTFGTYEGIQKPIQTYLNLQETKEALGFNPDIIFKLKSQFIFFTLYDDFMKSDCIAKVETILKSLPVIIFNGSNDLIVPNPAAMRYVYNLSHEYTTEFQAKDFDVWKVNDKVVGYKKQAGNLEFRIVNQAGHFVPMDQPEASFDLIKSFVERNKQESNEI